MIHLKGPRTIIRRIVRREKSQTKRNHQSDLRKKRTAKARREKSPKSLRRVKWNDRPKKTKKRKRKSNFGQI